MLKFTSCQQITNSRHSKGKKKETPPQSTPPPPPPTPPYPKHVKPIVTKEGPTGRRNMRKQAECRVFPWHREDIDFKQAKADATWDDSIYDQQMLDKMAETRSKNVAAIKREDDRRSEEQKQSRYRTRAVPVTGEFASATPSSNAEDKRAQRSRQQKEAKPNKSEMQGDPYHSGNFAFATPADQEKAKKLKAKTPDEIIAGAEAGTIDWNLCKDIMICWNPGKKGTTQELEQAVFSIKDTLVTREQLARTPVLTVRAAQCIIDFCPDILWREVLLRMIAEAGLANKDVRDRFCLNGCYCDKATITKRVTAALGAKQELNSARNKKKAKEVAAAKAKGSAAPKKKTRKGHKSMDETKVGGYAPGEYEWFGDNAYDWENYRDFFGNKKARKGLKAGNKRKRDMDLVSDDEEESSRKDDGEETEDEAKTPGSELTDTEMIDVDAVEEMDVEEVEDDEDAVSEQDSDILDEIED